jgi:cell division protein FtsW
LVHPPARSRRSSSAAAVRTSLLLLVVPAGVLTALGIVEVFSASSVYAFTQFNNSFWFFDRQLVYAALGIAAALLTSRMHYRAWRRLALPLLVVSVGLLVLALRASSASANGASRWIALGPLTVQPSEFAKLALIVFSAAVLSRKQNRLHDWRHLALPLGPVVATVAVIVLLQRDLGTTVILVGSVLLMLFAAGARIRHLTVAGLVVLAGSAYLILGTAYRRARFLSFVDPWKDPRNTGYQLIQGWYALGSGGWFGVGLGASRQKWQYLPNAHTDFIFAVLGEELGLIGEIVALAMFALMLYAGIRIAVRAPDTFGRLLAAGITSWIGLQTIVNLGAVTGLLPITGVPLPFVSFGGSALIVTLAAVGVLASIARSSARDGRSLRSRARSRGATA